MMAVGALIATLCGSCALLVASTFFTSSTSLSWSFLLLPALLGGLPALGGVVLFRQGLKRFRGPRPRLNAAETFD